MSDTQTKNPLLLRISQFLLQSEKGMIREQDIRNLCGSDEEYETLIIDLVSHFENLGIGLIRTIFDNERFYVLTIPGKDEKILPSMYGVLALLFALYTELGTDMTRTELHGLFQETWDDIEGLVSANYLQINTRDQQEYVMITPIGKAALKNIVKELNIKKILKFDQ